MIGHCHPDAVRRRLSVAVKSNGTIKTVRMCCWSTLMIWHGAIWALITPPSQGSKSVNRIGSDRDPGNFLLIPARVDFDPNFFRRFGTLLKAYSNAEYRSAGVKRNQLSWRSFLQCSMRSFALLSHDGTQPLSKGQLPLQSNEFRIRQKTYFTSVQKE